MRRMKEKEDKESKNAPIETEAVTGDRDGQRVGDSDTWDKERTMDGDRY